MAVVKSVLVSVEVDTVAEGYFTVSTYVNGPPGTTRGTGMYRRLSWTEAVDVMLVLLDENRPGQVNDPESAQVTLW